MGDYSSIVILIYGSIFPILYYGLLCITVFIVSLTDCWYLPALIYARAIVYVVLGLIGGGILSHIYVLSLKAGPNSDSVAFRKTFAMLVGMGICYIIGVTFYATKFPE